MLAQMTLTATTTKTWCSACLKTCSWVLKSWKWVCVSWLTPTRGRAAEKKKASRRMPFLHDWRLMTTAAAVATATAFFHFAMVVLVIMAVTVAAAATVTMFVIVTMVVTVLTVNVTMSQFFFGCFTDSHHFYVEVQILTCQHVVTVNHNVVTVNFSDLNRNRPLVGVSQETHTHFQLFNTRTRL